MRFSEACRFSWENLIARRSFGPNLVVGFTLVIACGISIAAFGLITGKHRLAQDRLERNPFSRSLAVGDNFRTKGRIDADVVLPGLERSIDDKLEDSADLLGVFPFVVTDEIGFPKLDGLFRLPNGLTADFCGSNGHNNPVFATLPDATRKRLPDCQLIITHQLLEEIDWKGDPPGELTVSIRGNPHTLQVATTIPMDMIDNYYFVVDEGFFFDKVMGNGPRFGKVDLTITDPRFPIRTLNDFPEDFGQFLARKGLDLTISGQDNASVTLKVFTTSDAELSVDRWRGLLAEMAQAGTKEPFTASEFEYASEQLDGEHAVRRGPYNVSYVSFRKLSNLKEGIAAVEDIDQLKDHIDKETAKEKLDLDRELQDSTWTAARICLAIGLLLSVLICAFQYMRFKTQSAEIGLLRAIGFSGFEIFRMAALESLVIWIFSVAIGLLLARALGSATCSYRYGDEVDPLLGFVTNRELFKLGAEVGVACLIFYLCSVAIAVLAWSSNDPGKLLREE